MIEQAVNAQPLETKADFLFQLDIFNGIHSARVKGENKPARDFLKICREFEYKAGSVIAHKDDVVDNLYIVREGQLQEFEIVEGDNRELVYRRGRIYSSGDHFDDMWLFKASTHPSLIRARRDGRLILIKGHDFVNFLKAYPQTLRSIYPHLSPDAKSEIKRSRFKAYVDDLYDPQQGRIGDEAPGEDEESEIDGTLDEENTQDQLKRYRTIGLLEEEFVEFDQRRSKKILGFRLTADFIVTGIAFVIGFALVTVSGFSVLFGLALGLAFAIFPLLDALIYWVNWRYCFFLITNRRIIRYEYLPFKFKTNIEKVDLDKVQSVNTETRNFIEDRLKIGTAAITTAVQSSVIYFDSIDNPVKVEKTIKKIGNQQKAIASSRFRASMRQAIHDHFALPPAVQEVEAPRPPAPKQKGMWERLRAEYVVEERPDAILYHKHPVALIRAEIWPIVTAFVLLVIGYIGFFFAGDIMSIPAVWGSYALICFANLIWAWWQFEDWHNDTYEITDRYIFDIDRLPLGFGESRKQAELSKVENVRTEQDGFLPTTFDYGDVHVETAGVDANIVFENVRNPSSVQNAIFSRRDSYQKKQADAEANRLLDQTTTLIEMYDEARSQRRIPMYTALPPLHEEDDHEEDGDLEYYTLDDL